MRDRFPVKRRHGHTQGQLKPVLPDDIEEEQLEPGVAYTHQRAGESGFFEKEVTWRVTPAGVEEEVAIAGYWGHMMILLTMIVSAGTVLNAFPAPPGLGVLAVALQLCGLVGIVWLVLRAMWTGFLPEQYLTVESTETPYSGALFLIIAHILVAIAVGGFVAVVAAGLAALIVFSYVVTASVERRTQILSAKLTHFESSLPVAARRHILLTGCGAAALFGVSALYLDVRVAHIDRLVGLSALSLAWIGLLLWTINTRRAARLHVVAAVGVTGLVVVTAPLASRPSISVAANVATPLAISGQLLIATSLLGLWVLLAKHQLRTQKDAIVRFVSTGRKVNTEVAAILAYGVMVSSALLGLGALSVIGTLYLAGTNGVTGVTVLVCAVAAVPLGYFITGSVYQLWGLYKRVVEIRQKGRPVIAQELGVAIDPDYDLWLIEEDGFLTGAYYDPYLSAIVLSQGTVDVLRPEQLEAVIAHEESHFIHRGAWLQFLFTIACSFALLGKNVVFSIYDFREREFTADQYAVERLADESTDGGLEPLVSVLEARQDERFSTADSQLAGFFPTMTWDPRRHLQQAHNLFALYYGGYAGTVHPDVSERRAAIEEEFES